MHLRYVTCILYVELVALITASSQQLQARTAQCQRYVDHATLTFDLLTVQAIDLRQHNEYSKTYTIMWVKKLHHLIFAITWSNQVLIIFDKDVPQKIYYQKNFYILYKVESRESA